MTFSDDISFFRWHCLDTGQVRSITRKTRTHKLPAHVVSALRTANQRGEAIAMGSSIIEPVGWSGFAEKRRTLHKNNH